MTTAIQLFNFEGLPIRTGGTADQPWWVAADVCAVLGIANARDAVSGFAEDEKSVATTDTPGGKQQMLVVSESGLYRLVFKSRKPEAERFRRWVFSEVLPTIRKTGGYGVGRIRELELQLELAKVALEEKRLDIQQMQIAPRGRAKQYVYPPKDYSGHEWYDLVAQHIERQERVTTSEIVTALFNIPFEQQNNHYWMPIAGILRQLGYQKVLLTVRGAKRRCWIKP